MKYQRINRSRKYVIAILLCVSFFIEVRAQTVSLQLQNTYSSGESTMTPFIVTTDLNRDGYADVVSVNTGLNNYVGYSLNNGGGAFGGENAFAHGSAATTVAVGDFNRDGFNDLALGTSNLTGGINIQFGAQVGFSPGPVIGTPTTVESVSSIATADFNGDGNLDLAFTKQGGYNTAPTNAVKILFGDGMGGFSGLVSFAAGFGGGRNIVVSDFNVDGRPDIAMPAGSAINIYLNNGAGGFTSAQDVTNVTLPNKIVAADFNRYCIPDLAVSRVSTGNTVSIILGTGSGTFGSPLVIPVSNQPENLAVGDFNRDKKVDLAIRRSGSAAATPNFTILPGNGGGGFGSAFELTLAVPTAGVVPFLATSDVNRDGKDDIIIGRQGGFFNYWGNSALFTRTENDYDGDLKTDLAVFRPSSGNWFVQQTTKGFLTAPWGNSTDKLTPADYDGDGKTDIAIWREGPPFAAFWILQSSDATVRMVQFGDTGDDWRVVGDWDGDGKADQAVYRGGNQSYFFIRGSLNNPNGNITYLPWGTTGDAAVRGDFDGDGRNDAAVFRPSNSVWYILRSSDGQVVYQTWGLPSDRRVTADYDADGKTDLAVFRPSNNFWYILNSSNSTATYRQWGSPGDSLTPGDYNGDGRTDVAVSRGSEGRWYLPQCADFKLNGHHFGQTGDIPLASAFVP